MSTSTVSTAPRPRQENISPPLRRAHRAMITTRAPHPPRGLRTPTCAGARAPFIVWNREFYRSRLRPIRLERLQCRGWRRQERLNGFWIRWHERNGRAIGPQCRWQLFEERSPRSREEPSECFPVVSRKEKV